MSGNAEKLPEPEALAMLRHRFGRTIEIWTAYNAFRNREIEVGPDKTCTDDLIVEQTTHTLLVTFYSFVYSLFDKSGVNFQNISQTILGQLTPAAREARAIVVATEEHIHSDLAKIRSNIGFHQGDNRKKQHVGYGAYNTFHPLAPMLIMHGLRAFFRETSKIYAHSEPHAKEMDEETTVRLLELCRELKREIDTNKGVDLSSIFINLGERLAAEEKPRKSALTGHL